MNNFDIIEIDESNDSTVELNINQDNINDIFSSDEDEFDVQKKSKIPRLDNDVDSSKKQKEVNEREEEVFLGDFLSSSLMSKNFFSSFVQFVSTIGQVLVRIDLFA